MVEEILVQGQPKNLNRLTHWFTTICFKFSVYAFKWTCSDICEMHEMPFMNLNSMKQFEITALCNKL